MYDRRYDDVFSSVSYSHNCIVIVIKREVFLRRSTRDSAETQPRAATEIVGRRRNTVYRYCSRAMRDAQLKRDKLFKENRKNECKRLRDSNCTTLMLIVVVTVFLMTEIPLAVVTVSDFFSY